ncbi:MAG: efflux transporter outer membrane subunit [Flavobacteriales bacterium]|nr:efflux transporter outer membrane subunit [Flavobacteriales bacterium]
MKLNKLTLYFILGPLLLMTACGIPKFSQRTENKEVPQAFVNSNEDTVTVADIKWKDFFTDPNLISLIDTALANNQEYNIIQQEIFMRRNEISAKKGEILPSVDINAGAGFDKAARYTRDGAVDANVEIEPGEEIPEPLQDYKIAFDASWEIDIWRKLRNSRDAAVQRYLASVEGQQFMKTKLIEEVASSYYELLSLDKQLAIVNDYITLQSNALKVVKIQKEVGEVTELAVRRFQAEVLSTKSIRYELQQEIVMTENRINFLLGRFPQPIVRNIESFENNIASDLSVGVPSQLLENRMDIREAEYELEASKLDVKVAKAQFYPSVSISAGVGLQAFNPTYLIKSPQSILYSMAGDLVAPLINRKAIKASYLNANAKQMAAVYNYEKTVLNAYLEVYNQVSKIDNITNSYNLKSEEVEVLNGAINIANDLFTSAKADYMEVLMTQRDALDAKMEQVEYRKNYLLSIVNLYKACGGGL